MTIDLNPGLAQWFTPDWLADHLIDSMCGAINEDLDGMFSVLEPAAGNGALIRAIARSERLNYADLAIDAVEYDGRFLPGLEGTAVSLERSASCRMVCVEICNYLERPAPPERYDIAITNPPFTRGMEGPFMAKLLDECNFIAAILPSRSLHGIARYDAIWKRFELAGRAAPEWAIRSIKYCKRRPKFAGTNGGKDEIVIVAMERHAASGSTLINPSISWI